MGIKRDKKSSSDSDFSVATKELLHAQASRNLSIASAPAKSDANEAGFDPYNTSGSFDRKKHWERVGKR